MTIHLMIRGYGGGDLIFDEEIDVEESDLEQIAEQQILRLVAYPKHMLEVEFLDEPDPTQRFLRIGTDASRMVMPWKFNLDRMD